MNAIIFPGQGAQYPGMGKSLNDNFAQAKGIFLQADNCLGCKLSDKCFFGTEAELKETSLQQLAILTVSIAAFEVFKTKQQDIAYVSGLSLGEYSCLYAAGVLSLDAVLHLVKERAMAMEKAAKMNSSTMLAVMGAARKVLKEKSHELKYYLANINSPQQIVISLKKEDKDKVVAALESLGAKVIELAVSGGFHSPFMEPAKLHLANVVAGMEFHDAKIPIVSNVTARAHTLGSEIKKNLLDQLVSSVLWNDCVEFMAGQGVTMFYEAGPSRVLKGLLRKINPGLKVVNIEKAEDLTGISA